jgi:hypothetical protein
MYQPATRLIRQRSLQIALLLWFFISLAAPAPCHGTMPLPLGPHPNNPVAMVISTSIALVFLVPEIGLVALITWRRSIPNLAERAPDREMALRESKLLRNWTKREKTGRNDLLAGTAAVC